MSNVIQGPWGGRTPQDQTVSAWDGETCRCGSAWWKLWLPEEDKIGPAVCMDSEGRITGYRGFLRCLECGALGE